MRNFIIAVTLFLFALAGYIMYRAWEIPANVFPPRNIQKEAAPDRSALPPAERPEEPAAKEAGPVLVDKLQARIARLEEELTTKNEEVQETAPPEKPENSTRVLTVLGAGAFGSGQIVIHESMKSRVIELAAEIKNSPDDRIIVEGHTDNIPISIRADRRYRDNMELSFLRAKAVADVLVQEGIPVERISVIGYGDTRPVDSNETDEGRVQNRRVEVKLVPGEGGF